MSDLLYRTVRFDLVADAEPCMASRLLLPFSRRGVLPDDVRMRRRGAVIEAALHMAAMPADIVQRVEGNLRQVVGVRTVSVTLGRSLRAVA